MARYASFDSSVTKLVSVDDTYVVASGTNLVNFLNADTDGLVTFIVVQGPSGSSNRTYWKSKEHADGKPPFLRIVTDDSRLINIPTSLGVGADTQITELTATNVNYGAASYSIVGKVGNIVALHHCTASLIRPRQNDRMFSDQISWRNQCR
jgi:hypothetical protein